MPTPIGHTLIGLGIRQLFNRNQEGLFSDKKDLALVCCLSLLPDLDFIVVFITNNLFYHRTFTHSLLFAIGAALLVRLWIKGKDPGFYWRNFFIVLAHVLADFFVRDGLHHSKVMFFFPLQDMYNSPVSLFLPINLGNPQFMYEFSSYQALIVEIFVSFVLFLLLCYSRRLVSYIYSHDK